MPLIENLSQNLRVLYHLVKPIQGDNHQERLEDFYQGQAQDYDAFRKRLLQGREELYQMLIQHPGQTWLDLGGGTGANLEAIADHLDKLQKLYIVDLCPSLLQVARDRVSENGWSNVEIVEADVTQFIPPEETVDFVTFSYSLTMIPDWFRAIDHAYRLLKPGGIIGVVDFYISRKHPPEQWLSHSGWSRHFWPAWFSRIMSFYHPNMLLTLITALKQFSLLSTRQACPSFPGLRCLTTSL